jgi:sodium-dependent phosphate transporter
MEMGAAITVLIAARNGIPVSTTNCIVGATMGVGLMNYDFKSVN